MRRAWLTVCILLPVLLVPQPGCTSESEDTVANIFDEPVGLRDISQVQIGSEPDEPAWDYPDIDLADGTIKRLIWLPVGEAKPMEAIVKTTPEVTSKEVAVAIVAGFPPQIERDSESGTIRKLGPNLGLEALSLTGPFDAVESVTEVVTGVQKSIPQIEVAIRVVEVLETDSFAFGIDTAFGSVERNDGPTSTFFNNAATALGLPEIPGRGGSFSPGSINPPLLVSLGTISNGVQMDFLIRALKLFSRTDLLSAPHIRVLNGHTAQLTSGEEIPFFQPAFNASGFTAVTTNFKNVGIKLYIVPTVLGRDMVRINLTTAVESVTGESTFQSGDVSVTNPVITKRLASTLMDVHDGDTAIIGGLLTRAKFNSENRVPVLGEIPILNFLFSSRSKQTVQSNLIFFISPRIIDPSQNRRRMITPAPPIEDEEVSDPVDDEGN